jgi:dsRNA-specific ribonuclease
MKFTGFSAKNYTEQNQANLAKMRQNLKEKRYLANFGKAWGVAPQMRIWGNPNGAPSPALGQKNSNASE